MEMIKSYEVKKLIADYKYWRSNGNNRRDSIRLAIFSNSYFQREYDRRLKEKLNGGKEK